MKQIRRTRRRRYQIQSHLTKTRPQPHHKLCQQRCLQTGRSLPPRLPDLVNFRERLRSEGKSRTLSPIRHITCFWTTMMRLPLESTMMARLKLWSPWTTPQLLIF